MVCQGGPMDGADVPLAEVVGGQLHKSIGVKQTKEGSVWTWDGKRPRFVVTNRLSYGELKFNEMIPC